MDAKTLEDRVKTLEDQVAEMRAQIAALSAAPPRVAPRSQPTPALHEPRPARTQVPKQNWSAADVIARLGIALLLLGVAFLLKLTIDYGWLTEGVRVLMGGALGAGLIGAGVVLGDSRRSLGAVLMGGGVVALYATVFGAHVLYNFIGLEPAFALMGGVTVMGTALALKQNYSAISAITALGGLITPFLLAKGDPAAPLLAIHTAILIAGLSGVYAARGWAFVQLLNIFGGGISMAVAVGLQSWEAGATGIVTTLAGVALGGAASFAGGLLRKDVTTVDRFTVIFGPFFTFSLLSVAITQTSLVVAALVVGAALGVMSQVVAESRRWALVHTGIGVGLMGVLSVLDVEPIAAALGAVALVLNLVSWREADERGMLRIPGFLATAALGIWCIVAMVSGNKGPAFFNPDGLLLMLGVTVLAVTGWTHANGLRWLYLHAALAAGMALIYDQMLDVAYGEVITTALWGAMGVLYVAVGIAKERGQMQVAGIFVMLVTAGKLLFFDLDTVATIWRVILFMGFGAVLLVLSFVFSKRQPETREPADADASSPNTQDV